METIAGASLLFLSLSTYIVLKRFEINDAWKASSSYEVGKSSALELKPIISMNAHKGNDFGLALKYSF